MLNNPSLSSMVVHLTTFTILSQLLVLEAHAQQCLVLMNGLL